MFAFLPTTCFIIGKLPAPRCLRRVRIEHVSPSEMEPRTAWRNTMRLVLRIAWPQAKTELRYICIYTNASKKQLFSQKKGEWNGKDTTPLLMLMWFRNEKTNKKMESHRKKCATRIYQMWQDSKTGPWKVSTGIKAKAHFSGRGIVTRRLHQ